MTQEQAEQIVEMIQDAGGDAHVDASYSGRGMYGKTCVGITTDSPLLLGWAAGYVGVDASELPRRKESMGMQTIYCSGLCQD